MFFNPFSLRLSSPLSSENLLKSQPKGSLPYSFIIQGLSFGVISPPAFTGNASTFTANAGIYQKVYYPRLINPLANCTSALFGFSIQALFFLGYFCIYKFLIPTEEFFTMTWAMLLLPLLIPLCFARTGMGLWMSVLTAKYRDFNQITGFLAQALMYATPIIYPLSEIPETVSILGILEPHGSCRRNLSFCLLGQRLIFRPTSYLFGNVCPLHPVVRHVLFQAHGETRCRLSIIHGFLSRYRSYQPFQKIPLGNHWYEQPQGRPQSLVGSERYKLL